MILQKPTELQKLIMSGRSLVYPKGQILPSTDDDQKLSMVKSGFVKRYLISNEGNISIQIIYGPGSIFPLTHVYKLLLDQDIYRGPEVFYYETISSTVIYSINNDTLLEAVQKSPLLFRDFFSVAGQHLQSTIRSLENSSLPSSYKRVAHLLVVYARQFGTKFSGGTRITLPLTHLLIASVLNLTRETVTQNMIQLRDNKLIKTNHYVVIPDVEKLKEEAYGS